MHTIGQATFASFGTRSTISAQDRGAIAAGRGIGAAREWVKSEFERYARDCGGCLEVKTDMFTQAPAERIPQPTQITNVYAVLKGSDPEAAKRVALAVGAIGAYQTWPWSGVALATSGMSAACAIAAHSATSQRSAGCR